MHAHFPTTISNRWLKESTDVCPPVGIDLGLHSGLGPGSVGKAVNKSFVNTTDVISAAASPRCTIDFTCNHVNLLRNHDCTDGEDDLLGDASLLGVDVADM